MEHGLSSTVMYTMRRSVLASTRMAMPIFMGFILEYSPMCSLGSYTFVQCLVASWFRLSLHVILSSGDRRHLMS